MTPRDLLLAVRSDALAFSEPRARVREALAAMPRPTKRVRAIAVGKAAGAMLEGARDAWSLAPDEGRTFGGAHPVPDRTSIDAAEAALAFAASGGDAIRLFLVSGGASAMLCAPYADFSLAGKQDVTRALLRAGLDVARINVVRAHLSRIKGGGLAKAAGDHPRITVVVSDVLFGDASAVGSGPSLPDASTVEDARRIAESAGLFGLPLHETPKDLAPAPCVVASSPEVLARAATAALEQRGFSVTVLAPSIASVDELATEYVQTATSMAPRTAVVRVAEPSLVVPASAGRGGRSTHLAARVAQSLPPGVAFLAAASDGVDGVSGTAGAIVTGPIDGADNAIARFDTGELHLRAGTAIAEHPTGNNLADLHVVLRR